MIEFNLLELKELHLLPKKFVRRPSQAVRPSVW